MRTVAVGLSGGVDSAVTAYLLQKAGWQVVGVTLRTWKEEDQKTPAGVLDAAGAFPAPVLAESLPESLPAPIADAAAVARALGVELYVADVRDSFRRHVVEPFIAEYRAGRTPNPCVVCNPAVKFAALTAAADALGADAIATGHYARVGMYPETGRYCLWAAAAAEKDQTYALCGLTQAQLRRLVLPLGERTKPEVREIARQAGLPVAQKPDSQEICFVENDDYAAFLERENGGPFPAGNFIDRQGNPLGRNKGYIHYTVGQRRGLGLGFGARKYVLEVRAAENRVVLGENDELFATVVRAVDLRWQALPGLESPRRVSTKIRYGKKAAPGWVSPRPDGSVECVFDTPQRAPAPGQALVLYDGDAVLGGGTIVK